MGEDAVPGTMEFDLFIKEVQKEMIVKAGQKCTAVRRIIVPEKLLEDVRLALIKRLSKIVVGDPKVKEVRMGALAGRPQVIEVSAMLKIYHLKFSFNPTSIKSITPS